MFRHVAASLVCIGIVANSLSAAEDDLRADRAFRQLRVIPSQLELRGSGAHRGLLVEGEALDGRWVDLTRRARYKSDQANLASVDSRGVVLSRGDGIAMVQVEAAGMTASVRVEVTASSVAAELDFENDIVPILSRYGCNASGCHGKAEGQNGFKLSVFGFDPKADFVALTQEGRGRRVFVAAPSRSLLLSKASGQSPHGGGSRIKPGSRAYERIQRWIESGAKLAAADPAQLLRLSLTPGRRVVDMGQSQQLRAIATYSDGREIDVTDETRYVTNQPALVSVDEDGVVTAGDAPGQAAVMANYMGRVDQFQILIPRATSLPLTDNSANDDHDIDGPVQAQLRRLRITSSPIAEDQEFLRRVYLDIIGTLPTPEEAQRFLTNSASDRRAALVDELLERPEYAVYWSLKWSDILHVDRQALGHKNAYAYYNWIQTQFKSNRPFDAIARDVVAAAGPLRDAPQGHFYSAVKGPGAQASSLSQIFLGVRIACAECHHHPFDRWSQTDFQGMASYFTVVKKTQSSRGPTVFANNSPAARKHPRSGKLIHANPLGSARDADGPAPRGDQRMELARWMTSADNPWFSRAVANRYWAHFLGRGIVEPVDDFRATNPPSNPELLDALAARFSASGFDIKQLIRDITSSKTYQRSATPNDTNQLDEQNYSRRLFKRLEAEVLLDAIAHVTGVRDKFEGVPFGSRAIGLWDSQTRNFFLKQFGRPMRKTACECERSSSPNVGQVLHLLNSQDLANKISHASGRAAKLSRQYTDDEPIIRELYLAALSRRPTEQELAAAREHLQGASQTRRENVEDLTWALINSLEFVFNH